MYIVEAQKAYLERESFVPCSLRLPPRTCLRNPDLTPMASHVTSCLSRQALVPAPNPVLRPRAKREQCRPRCRAAKLQDIDDDVLMFVVYALFCCCRKTPLQAARSFYPIMYPLSDIWHHVLHDVIPWPELLVYIVVEFLPFIFAFFQAVFPSFRAYCPPTKGSQSPRSPVSAKCSCCGHVHTWPFSWASTVGASSIHTQKEV